LHATFKLFSICTIPPHQFAVCCHKMLCGVDTNKWTKTTLTIISLKTFKTRLSQENKYLSSSS
jgi:hypothetical protein